MARATRSSSKAARSVRAPPPRTRATTSTPVGDRLARCAATSRRGASRPCTRASTRTHVEGEAAAPRARRGSRPRPRCPSLVTSPTRSGTSGSGQRGVGARAGPRPSSRGEQLGLGPAQLAERVGRVDRGHPQLELAAGRVPVEPAPDPHLGAVGHPHAAAGPGEGGVHRALVAGRQHHAEQALPLVAGLDEREVDVARAGPGQVADLAPHPHLVAERGPQRVADAVGQLGDRQVGSGIAPTVGSSNSDIAAHARPGGVTPPMAHRDRTGRPPDRHAARRLERGDRRLPDHGHRAGAGRDRQPDLGARAARRARRARRRRPTSWPASPSPTSTSTTPAASATSPAPSRRPPCTSTRRAPGTSSTPRKLVDSAAMVYGDLLDSLYGRLDPDRRASASTCSRTARTSRCRQPHAHHRRLARPRQAPPRAARLRERAAVRRRRGRRAPARRRHPAAGDAAARLRPRPGHHAACAGSPHRSPAGRRPGPLRARARPAWPPSTRPRRS